MRGQLLNLRFVQFIQVFFLYETLPTEEEEEGKYNLYILLRITSAASGLVEGSGKSLSEMVIMIVIIKKKLVHNQTIHGATTSFMHNF